MSVSAALAWLALCYLAVWLGWRRTASRLWVGVAVTFVFALLPYVVALPAFNTFVVPECKPYGGGICGLFDGNVDGVHILARQVWISVIGLPLGFLAFFLYLAAVLGPLFALAR